MNWTMPDGWAKLELFFFGCFELVKVLIVPALGTVYNLQTLV